MRHLSARITSSKGRAAGERGPVVVQWVQAQTLFSPELPTWPPPLLQSRRGNGHPGANLTDSDYGLLRCRPAHSGSLHPPGEPDDFISEYTGVVRCIRDRDGKVFRVGKVKAYRIHADLADQSGESVFDVCDAHSQELNEVY